MKIKDIFWPSSTIEHVQNVLGAMHARQSLETRSIKLTVTNAITVILNMLNNKFTTKGPII